MNLKTLPPFALTILIGLSSCSKDEPNEPEPPIQPETEEISTVSTDWVILEDCAGFKFEYTDNVNYFYALLLSEEVAQTTSEEALETYLSDKNITNRNLPKDNVWHLQNLAPSQSYVLFTRSFDKNDTAGDIISKKITTPSNDKQPIVEISALVDDNKWFFNLTPNTYTACYYYNIYDRETVGFGKGQIAWQFYHDILENPGRFQNTGAYEFSPEVWNETSAVVTWGQTVDGKLSGGMSLF